MATLGADVLTLADWAKRLDPNGKVPLIVEMLSQTNEILEDILWMEANQALSHQSTVRTGLPQVFWRLMNTGTQPSKSTTAQSVEAIGMLDAWSEVDRKLAELGGNVGAFRMSEGMAFIEAMMQEKAQTLFFGNQGADPEEFNGLAIRYSNLTDPTADNIIDAGGTGSDNSSVWLVVWGPNQIFGVFPKGSVAGLTHEDMGVVTVETTAGIAGNRMRAYQEHWEWSCGLVVKDWRFAVRIANIDISDLVTEAAGAAELQKDMTRAMYRIPNLRAGNARFYMNRTTVQQLDIQRRADVTSGGGLTFDNVDGKRIMMFRGIPIRVVDSLIETEARVVA